MSEGNQHQQGARVEQEWGGANCGGEYFCLVNVEHNPMGLAKLSEMARYQQMSMYARKMPVSSSRRDLPSDWMDDHAWALVWSSWCRMVSMSCRTNDTNTGFNGHPCTKPSSCRKYFQFDIGSQ